MISLHQLFRVLSRVSVDPAAPFYATSLQSPIAGAPGGCPKGPSGPSSPLKVPRPVSDSGILTTCTTTSPDPGALTPGATGMQLEETLYDEGDSSSTFPFSSNSCGTGDLEGLPVVAAGGLINGIGGPPKSLGEFASHKRPSPLCRSSSNSKSSSSSSSSSTPSTSSSPPPLCSTSVSSSPSLSACSALWGPPLTGKEALGSPEALLAALAHPEGNNGGPYAAVGGAPGGITAAGQLQHFETRLFGCTTAASPSIVSGTQEQTEIEGPSSRPYRIKGRQRRRPWRQQTPWDSSSRAAAATAAAAGAPLLQQREDNRMQTRGGAATTAVVALNEGETVALPPSRRRSVAPRGQQPHSHVSPAAAAASASSSPNSLSLSLGLSDSGQRGVSGGISGGDSRLLGVCFSPPKDVWRARITVEGKQFEQQFSVKRHGFDGARILATRWRAKMETARISRPLILP